MGDEISSRKFSERDFRAFDLRIRNETKLLREWFQNKTFSTKRGIAGCELEAWLVDRNYRPAPVNDHFLGTMCDPMIVPELSSFNVEFNVPPIPLRDKGLQILESELSSVWARAGKTAASLGVKLMMIGILPTVRETDLTLKHISPLNRFFALNEQILRSRKGRPIKIDIKGKDHLQAEHDNVMLESATTSFQIHLQVAQDEGVRFYNASKIASAPVVGAAANSPYLFARDLWDETRIPLFEQAVSVGERDYAERVTFGIRFLDESLMEFFEANRQRYPALLPLLYDEDPERMYHLCLHNGTIWRWNRALIGFDDDQTPHLRIEHRVVPAGPTIKDSIANAAFYYGIVHALALRGIASDDAFYFYTARDNFYEAARKGLNADIIWLDGRKWPIRKLILEELLPQAHEAMRLLGLNGDDIDHYLGIIEKRVASGKNGAWWQRAYVQKHECNSATLCAAYYERQESGMPVHEWPL